MAKVAVLTNSGEGWCAGRLAGSEATTGKYIGWGTGVGTAFKGSTALLDEDSGGSPAYIRASGTVTVSGYGSVEEFEDADGTSQSAKWQVEGTLVSNANNKTITEAGAFSAEVSGILIVHTTFDGLGLNEGDSITFTFTIDPS